MCFNSYDKKVIKWQFQYQPSYRTLSVISRPRAKALGRYHRHGSDMRADIKIAM